MSVKSKVFMMVIAVAIVLSFGVSGAFALTNSDFSIEGSIIFERPAPLDTNYPLVFTKISNTEVSFIQDNNLIDNYLKDHNGELIIPERIKFTKGDGKNYNVTTVGERAFYFCNNLTSPKLPNSITNISKNAFTGCAKLSSITIPEKVFLIDDGAFSSCNALTNITIPSSVSIIGNMAFSDCTGLISVTMNEGLDTIEQEAFASCFRLTSINIPSSVTILGKEAFVGCTKLTNVTFDNPVGWYVVDDPSETSGINLSASDLRNSSTVVKYLEVTYVDKSWKRG